MCWVSFSILNDRSTCSMTSLPPMISRNRSGTSSRKRRRWVFSPRWPPSRRVPRWPAGAERSTAGTATATAPTARLTTGIAMAAGITGGAISTAANSEATRETEVCKRTATASLYQRKGSGRYDGQTLFNQECFSHSTNSSREIISRSHFFFISLACSLQA